MSKTQGNTLALHHTMNTFLTFIVFLTTFCSHTTLAAHTKRPHIIFVMADDMGRGTKETAGKETPPGDSTRSC